MIELEGNLLSEPVSILVDPGASLSYVNPKLVEICKLQSQKFRNPWLLQLATREKRNVYAKIPKCTLEISEQQLTVDLNILPLGSYNVLLGMDWLEKHWTLVGCKEKVIYYRMQDATHKEIKGIKKPLQLRPIAASQMSKCMRKGCQIYAIQVGFTNSKEKNPTMENIPVVQDFMDVFPKEIPGFPPRRDTDFTIELMTRESPISRELY